MISKVVCAILCGYLLVSGCGLTEPDYTNTILPTLLHYPEITPPPQTTANSTNPGYLANHCPLGRYMCISEQYDPVSNPTFPG